MSSYGVGMDTSSIDTFRTLVLAEADRLYSANPITLALAKAALEAYCAAYRAYLKTVGNTVTSYSVNGRSVTKATADATAYRETYRTLREYFPDLPEDATGAAKAYAVSFAEVPL